MKILLIHPYVTSENRHTVLTEPLGLACLASYLHDHEVDILDLFAEGFHSIRQVGELYRKGISDPSEITKRIAKIKPDIVGITCNFTAYAQDAIDIANIVKEYNKHTIVVIGGSHATMEAESMLVENDSVDVIVRGEGEITFADLVEAVQKGERFDNIQGLSFKDKNGRVISNPKRALIMDMNDLPIPDRSSLPMDLYFETNKSALAFTKREPVATIMTSRGCPYNCIFCSTKVMWERKFRPRSAELVVEEIEQLINRYGVKEFAIMDDQFLIDKKRVHKICDLIEEKNIDVTFSIPSGTSVWLADEGLLRKMKNVGFYRLCFPIETGNEDSLKFIRKPINLEKAKKTIKVANKLGIWTQGNFIIGFPYETREEIQTTINYAFKSGLDYALFFTAKPYAGSEMFDIFKKEGLLTKVARGSNIEDANYDTKTMSAEELQSIRDRASKNFLISKSFFYLNPLNSFLYLLPKISTRENFSYAAKILFRIMKKTLTNKAR